MPDEPAHRRLRAAPPSAGGRSRAHRLLIRLGRRILALALAWLLAPAAQALDVALLLSSHQTPAYRTFAAELAAATAGGAHHILPAGDLDAGIDTAMLAHADLIVAAGAPALAAAARRGRPVLGVFVSRAQFDAVRSQAPEAALSAIVLDQPAARHLALARAVLPEARRIGLLFGPDSAAQARLFAELASADNPAVTLQPVSDPSELQAVLERTLKAHDALLVLPDEWVSGPAAARAVLLTSYRYRRPVLAYSRAYVEAGALAAVYSSSGDVARDVADWLAQAPAPQQTLPPVRAPRYFSVAINQRVARALNVDAPNEAAVLDAIRLEERR
ncbi:ABC transporter substrate-binding protein [Pseudothauera hydrothermalis]|uniref:ABC transporter substrate-binding protein n=1 Tax=Pseudothauera hydrothermalis TaxID=2184083 RepID=UPI0013C2F9B9|nr:ABC transporter substrate binding protein [Pseudothauera hydrothermalis]